MSYKNRIKKNMFRCGCCFNGARKCELKQKHYKSALRGKERFDAIENMRENGFEKETNAEIRDLVIRDFLNDAYNKKEVESVYDMNRFLNEEGLDLSLVKEKELSVKFGDLYNLA